MTGHKKKLSDRFPPSKPCTCEVCRSYCRRPGWWTVEEAARVIEAGLAGRMMLEMSADGCYGVLSPAFTGNEVNFALENFSNKGCTFCRDGLCELFGTGLQPLECRYCHHDRRGSGIKCHQAVGKDWNTPAGRSLVVHWCKITGFWAQHVLKTSML
jgi:hypothetical protein